MKLGLFDELNVFVASKVISKGLNFLTPNFELNVDLKFESVKKFNNDVLINYTRI
jgi:riboflavin biosynthesis pyrimidine reductase